MGQIDIHYTIVEWVGIFALACSALGFVFYVGAETVRSIRNSLGMGRKDK